MGGRRAGVLVAIACGCGQPSDPPGEGEASSGEATASSTSGDTGIVATTQGTGDGSDASGGSTSAEATTMAASDDAPPDDSTLHLQHLQALGTHNSYHVQPLAPILAWAYTHRPLPEQLDLGVRQFELDVWRNEGAGDFDVYHVDVVDEETTCATLSECVAGMAEWSAAHPEHHPILVMIEPKDSVSADDADAWLGALETTLTSAWPEDALIVPSMVQGAEANVRDGIAAEGWPLIADLRGRALFVLHDGGTLRDAYVADGLADKRLFPDAMGDLTAEYAAFHSMNDPMGQFEDIATVVAAGHLVRTRADADNVEPSAGDVGRRDAALASGAHFVSTDFPEPTRNGYVVEIPDGTPSRCNPLTAPPECTAEAIESLRE